MRTLRLLIPALCIAAFTQIGIFSRQEPEPVQPASANPYSIGERLVYTLKWDPPWYLLFLPSMEAGEVDLQLAGEMEYKGKKAWRIVFKAHSSGTLMKMAGVKVDDEFVFLTEPETFCALSISRKVREGKRKRQIEVEYLRDAGRLHFREMDESVDPPKLKKDEIKSDIPACVQDPFSAIFSLRRSNLRPEQEQNFVIGYDDRVKEIRTHVDKQEPIETPAGKFPAWNIRTVALMGGLFKEGGQFRLWLSADQRKVPLQFEVKVSLGKVIGKLKSMPNN